MAQIGSTQAEMKVEGNPRRGNGFRKCLQLGMHIACLRDTETA